MNELIFLFYIITVSSASLGAIKLGKEALIGLICVQSVLVNLFVTKEITLFGLTATASDALAVGITLSLNLLIEYWGKEIAKKTIWISFYCTIAFIIFSLFHLAYIPALCDVSDIHCQAILKPMPRIIFASLIVFLIVQNLDARLYGYLKEKFAQKFFILRNYTSIIITQLLDTILFSFLGLWGLNQSFSDISAIVQIIIISYIIKLVTIIIAVPFIACVKKIIKS